MAERTFPVADGTVDDSGQVSLAATYRSFSKMHPLHMLEGRWGSMPALPLNASFLAPGQSDTSFEAYFKA